MLNAYGVLLFGPEPPGALGGARGKAGSVGVASATVLRAFAARGLGGSYGNAVVSVLRPFAAIGHAASIAVAWMLHQPPAPPFVGGLGVSGTAQQRNVDGVAGERRVGGIGKSLGVK